MARLFIFCNSDLITVGDSSIPFFEAANLLDDLIVILGPMFLQGLDAPSLTLPRIVVQTCFVYQSLFLLVGRVAYERCLIGSTDGAGTDQSAGILSYRNHLWGYIHLLFTGDHNVVIMIF